MSLVSEIFRERTKRGCALLKSPINLGRRYSPGMVLAPKESSPLMPLENSLRALSRSLRTVRIFEAYSRNISPAFVSRISLPVRSKRRRERDLSSERIWPLTVGWVRKRSSAALEKLFRAATRQNVSRGRKQMVKDCFPITAHIETH